MNISSPGSVILFNQIAHLFNNTVTSSLRHVERTEASSSGPARNKEGCLILKETNFSPNLDPEAEQPQLWIRNIPIITGGLFTLLFLVGAPANLLSAAVFYKQGLKERINFCVFCLAVADTATVTLSFFLNFEVMYRIYIGPLDFFHRYFTGLNGFTWVSMFLTCVIAAERCFCVVSPLRAQRMLSTRTLAVIIISVSLILLAGMAAIAGPQKMQGCFFEPQTNITIYVLVYTEYYYKTKKILDPLNIFVYGIIFPFIAFTCVFVTTFITIKKLRSALDWRQQSSSASGVQHTGSLENHAVALTRMLIATSVLFVACISPTLIMQMAVYFVSELRFAGPYGIVTLLIWAFIYVLRCINSSLNFFVYYKMGSRFRHTLNQILCCGGGTKDVSNS